MRFSTVVKIGICLIILFFTVWSFLLRTQTLMLRHTVATGLAYEVGQFFHANKRLPHNWKEFAAWANEIRAKKPEASKFRHNASWYEDRFSLKWDNPLIGWEPTHESVLIVIDPQFKGIEQRFNEMMYTGMLSEGEKEAEAKEKDKEKVKP